MPDERISTVAKELSEDWDEGSFALYLPRPIVEVGGEKWRIFRKNALSALEDLDVRDGPAVEFIRSLNLAEFGGSGYAIFQSGGGFRHTRLSRRPFASLVRSDAPFILPLLADMSDRDTRWVLALDRNRPRLFLFDGTKLSLREDAFEDVDYEGVEERRLIQDDIFFHSSGRGSSGGARSPSIFHALGADQSRERDKTDEAFYREVIDALMNSLPGHVDRLVIFGDPHTVGPFEKLLAPTGLDVSTHHASGDALHEDRIEEVMHSTREPAELSGDFLSGEEEVRTAADRGQIDTVYVNENLACLDRQTGNPSEHLRLRTAQDLKREIAINSIAVAAIETGAQLQMFAERQIEDDADVLATLRWETRETG